METKITKIGDIVTFGRYPQGANGEVEPLEWRVLDVQDGVVLMITEYAIDCRTYHEELKNITWYNCDLRRWANGEFFNYAFDCKECQVIATTHNKNKDNPEWGAKGGCDTDDKVFCLSMEEARQYFSSGEDRAARPTVYAVTRGVYVAASGSCWWWLRSPGLDAKAAAGIDGGGIIRNGGHNVNYGRVAVRPACRVKLQ